MDTFLCVKFHVFYGYELIQDSPQLWKEVALLFHNSQVKKKKIEIQKD